MRGCVFCYDDYVNLVSVRRCSLVKYFKSLCVWCFGELISTLHFVMLSPKKTLVRMGDFNHPVKSLLHISEISWTQGIILPEMRKPALAAGMPLEQVGASRNHRSVL